MPVEILMPALSPTMEEGTLARWLVKEGDRVASGDVIAEIETDKATMEFEVTHRGTVDSILISEGTAGVKVNTPIATLLENEDLAGDASAETADKNTELHSARTTRPLSDRSDESRLFASPLARRLAVERGQNLEDIAGSGPRGRIVQSDLDAMASRATPSAPARHGQSTASSGKLDPDATTGSAAFRAHTEITLDGLRKTSAARLTKAKQTIPHVYLRRDIRLDPLLSLRTGLNAQLSDRDIRLSINDFIIKACGLALRQVPEANAIWSDDRILQFQDCDVAIAVAINGGLLTPVLREVDDKSLSALSTEARTLAARARDRKLAPQDYQGGSFSISNLGMYGIESFDAVINPPQSAILAVGAASRKPVVTDTNDIEVATMMSVTLSVDHRVIDGVLGARLLGLIVHNLENPLSMVA